MYQIRCDDYILFDPRDDSLKVLNPKFTLEANAVGGGSLTILPTHPYYSRLEKLKSVFELRQDDEIIFRGRMTADSRDFHNRVDVDLEGALAYTNDTIIPPFDFPDDFPEASEAANVVEYFLGWILDQHNAHAASWQQLKLGNVKVKDPNNYLARSSSQYDSTWNTLKSKLFDSALGGYLIVRYEADGNYVDYVKEFEYTNVQRVTFGENMLDITNDTDAGETYSAIMPLGAEVETTTQTEDGGTLTEKHTVTVAELPDGDLEGGLVKDGMYIYSRSAVEQYGWVCVPVKDATWNDVKEASNLQRKAIEFLLADGVKLSGKITFKAVDLHCTDDQIRSFRYGQNVLADSPVHGVSVDSYPLTKLAIDVLNPQNTTITIGDTRRTLVDINQQLQADAITRIEIAEKDIKENQTDISQTTNQLLILNTKVLNDCNEIILSALKTYVQTSNYEQFKETTESTLATMADKIQMNFTTSQQITGVNNKVTELYKYITFDLDGIIIGGNRESAEGNDDRITLRLDNGGIEFCKNGVPFGRWDGKDFYTGNIMVTVDERAQFGNFAYIPRSDGSLSFLKVGG